MPSCVHITCCLSLRPWIDPLGCFHLLVIVTSIVAANMMYRYLFESLLSFLLYIYIYSSVFHCLRSCLTVFDSGCTILQKQGCNFCTSFPKLFFNTSHPNVCEVVSNGRSDLHFPMTSDFDLNIFLSAHRPFVYRLWRSVCSSPLFFN